ncbi:MAG TPA: hypothetical protein VIP77_06040 [Jiangellaceae bacterium]
MCELCELTESIRGSEELVDIGTCWTANVRQAAGRPAIVLQVREHRAGLESLLPAEAAEMGTAIQTVAAAIARAPGVERVYAQSFNETPGQHVHVHLVPRFHGERDLGPNAAAVVPPAEFDIHAVLSELREPSETTTPELQPTRSAGRRHSATPVSANPDLVAAADAAVQAAATLRTHLDQLITDLSETLKELEGQREIEVTQARSAVQQARDLTDRFRKLYGGLPDSVATLKAGAASVDVATKRLRTYRHDFERVFAHQGAIDWHLSVVVKYVDVFATGLQPDTRAWRHLQENGAEHLDAARSSLRDLSDRSVEALRALGYEADRVELAKL